jgi:hypothetical protein
MQLMQQISWPVIIAGCLGATAAVFANMISLAMIGKINSRLPDGEKLSYLWWGTEVRKRFKQLFPGDKLIFLLDACVVVMILSFIGVIRFWVFG